MNTQIIHAKVGQLSEELQRKVLDYIEFLLQKYRHQVKKERFQFDWEGGLSTLKGRYQHQALE